MELTARFSGRGIHYHRKRQLGVLIMNMLAIAAFEPPLRGKGLAIA